MATNITSREIRLAGRPHGVPGPQHFELVSDTVPPLAAGQILIRNTWMSVDPYMRGRMDDVPSYLTPFQVGAALDGSAVGEVVDSRSGDIPVGATVSHFLGWRDYAVVDAASAQLVDVTAVPPQAYLGALGTTGLTAYVALTEVAPVRPGDTVFISAAAGAVGSVAGQIARLLGASTVIGSAGGPEKTKKLTTDFNFDVALDYKAAPIATQLIRAAPQGIDVYLDNVGGDHLAAAITAAKPRARFALVGAMSTEIPKNLFEAYWKELTLRGLLVTSYFDKFPEWTARATTWLTTGTLQTTETVLHGLDQSPQALLGVLKGENIGKMLVRLTS
ncbi:NADP-dependent oxidoreductase [Actinoplanes sp. CA-015351]|uniref:NADP-dependent oxidoreductase n=1 Tax=Actinoplanes sp. CA-015351 TaxID=3239897 RepID=UPI003D9578A5